MSVPALSMMQVPLSTDQDSHVPVTPSPAPETTEALMPMDTGIPVPDGPITIPIPTLTQAPSPTEAKDNASSEGTCTTRCVVLGTPPPTTVFLSESSASSSAHARRWTMTFVPFEAFISPAQTRGKSGNGKDKGKGEEKRVADASDPFVSIASAAARLRAFMSGELLGSQRHKARASWHGRRESEVAVFASFIVQGSLRQVGGAHAGTDAGSNDAQPAKALLQPPRQPRFSESEVSASPSVLLASPVPDVVPVMVRVPVPESEGGGEGPVEDMDVALENGMEVNENVVEDVDAGDVGVDSTHVDHIVALSEDAGGEELEMQEFVAVDEVDTSLELASVHLSQPKAEDVVEVVVP